MGFAREMRLKIQLASAAQPFPVVNTLVQTELANKGVDTRTHIAHDARVQHQSRPLPLRPNIVSRHAPILPFAPFKLFVTDRSAKSLKCVGKTSAGPMAGQALLEPPRLGGFGCRELSIAGTRISLKSTPPVAVTKSPGANVIDHVQSQPCGWPNKPAKAD